MKTSLNGRRLRKYRLNITIRETQSVMISRAVHRTEVGFQVCNANLRSEISDSSGHPSVESGHRPEENQVSRTSGSCSNPSSARMRSVDGCGFRKQTKKVEDSEGSNIAI